MEGEVESDLPIQRHRKAAVISQFWAGILSLIIFSSLTFTWKAYADFIALKSDMMDVKEAKIPERLASIETKLISQGKTIDKFDDKLDRVLTKR